MGTNKEILFSARDNGVESTMSRIRRSAKELSADMLRQASSTSSSQGDILRNYEQQIRLIERRNKIDAEGQKMAAKERLDRQMSSATTPEDQKAAKDAYRSEISGIGTSSKQDEMQTALLREIAEAMRLEARTQAEGEDRSRDNSTGGVGGGVGGRGGSGTGTTGDGGEDGSGGGRGRLSRMDATAYLMGMQQIMGAQDAAGGLMGASGVLTSMGGGAAKVGKLAGYVAMVGELINMQNDAAADIHKTFSTVSALTGISAKDMQARRSGSESYKFGYTREDYMTQILPQTMQSRGQMGLGSSSAERVMGVARGTGLDMGTIQALERAGARQMQDGAGNNSLKLISRMIASAEGTDAFTSPTGGLDFSRLQESMDEFISLQQSVFMRSGSQTNMNNSLFMSGRLERLGGAYKDDQYKWSTIQAMDKGISMQGSPEVQAIKMNILRKSMPGATYSEMMAEMEKGAESKHLMPGMFDFINQTGGDENSRAILMQQMFGGQMRWGDVNRMTSDANRGTFSGKMPMFSSESEDEIRRRTSGVVTQEMQQQIKRTQDFSDFKADPLGQGLSVLVDGIGDRFDASMDKFANRMETWFE